MTRDLVDVGYYEIVSGVKKQYKDIKPKYRSNFNKLVKIHRGYRIYCEDFDWSDIDEDLIPTDVLQDLVIVKIHEGFRNFLCNM